MNNQATIEKMQAMRLHGMLKAFQTTMEAGMKNDFTPDEMLAHLIEAEWDERYNRRLSRLLTNARFRYQASFQEIDFKTSRGLDKNKLVRLRKVYTCDVLAVLFYVVVKPKLKNSYEETLDN